MFKKKRKPKLKEPNKFNINKNVATINFYILSLWHASYFITSGLLCCVLAHFGKHQRHMRSQ